MEYQFCVVSQRYHNKLSANFVDWLRAFEVHFSEQLSPTNHVVRHTFYPLADYPKLAGTGEFLDSIHNTGFYQTMSGVNAMIIRHLYDDDKYQWRIQGEGDSSITRPRSNRELLDNSAIFL